MTCMYCFVFIMFACNVTETGIPNPRGKKEQTMRRVEANSSLKKGRKLFIGRPAKPVGEDIWN